MQAIMDLKTITHMRTLGTLWQKNGMSRVYFNDLPALMGLSCHYYKTGKISCASLNGETISNNAANKMVDRLSGKLWFDESDGAFHSQDLRAEDVTALVEAILAQLAPEPEQETEEEVMEEAQPMSTRAALLQDARRVLPRDIHAGDTIACWQPVRAYDKATNMWLPITEGPWRVVGTSMATRNDVDQCGRWTDATRHLVHMYHVAPVDDADFRAVPDDEGRYEILLRMQS